MLDYSRLRPACRKELERIDAADSVCKPELADLPASKAEAMRLGVTRIFTGRPCARGHIDRRNISDGCASCRRGPHRRAWENARDKTTKKSYIRAHGARRRSTKLNATPPWLTKAQIRAMELVYSDSTKLGWHVDHIIPLQGRKACGLHVPWNLRPLPGAENISKGNRINLAEEEASHWEWLVDTGQAIGKRLGVLSS